MKKLIKISTLLVILLFTGCLRFGNGVFKPSTTNTYNLSGDFELGESVYAVFTGTDVTKSSDYGAIKINGNVSSNVVKNIVGPEKTENTEIKRIDIGTRLRGKETKLTGKNVVSSPRFSLKNVVEGVSEENFSVEITKNTTSGYPSFTSNATAQAIDVIPYTSVDGNKTLNIWLDKEYLGNEEIKNSAIKLGQQFLNGTNTSDIYHWLTNVFGEEWGKTGYIDLISDTDTIDILLTNLNENYATSNYVMGYFDSRDTFKTLSYSKSNEKNMFYIDIRLLTGNFTSGQNKLDMKQDIYSTLAHEFVHMINWYQKDLLKDTMTEPWLNEMLAMIGEDLVDDKITVDGTKGVLGSKGRIAGFNANNNIEINDHDTSYDIVDYNIGAVYGLYLTRAYAYSDLSFLKNIMHNNKPGVEAIDYALTQKGINKTFIDTIKDFGKAVILSSADGGTSEQSTVYMNRSINSQNYGGIVYNFEPINVFTYGDFYYKATEAGFQGGANTYAELRNTSDTNTSETWSFSIPAGVEVQIIVKNANGSFNFEKTNELNNNITKTN